MGLWVRRKQVSGFEKVGVGVRIRVRANVRVRVSVRIGTRVCRREE